LILNLDRNGGLLDILPESRILIGVGSRQHDFKALTPADVVGSQITLTTPMANAHVANDLIAILSPNEMVKTGWLGLTGGDGASAAANPAYKSPAYIESMYVIGNNNSDGIGVMIVADGGYAHGFQVRYHRGPGAMCVAGNAFNVRNYQQDFCSYGFTSMGNGITLHDPCCTYDEPDSNLLKAVVRVISGQGFELIGGDIEGESYPGPCFKIEGTASGVIINGTYMAGSAGPKSTIIDIDNGSGIGGPGAVYDISGVSCGNQSETMKFIRDVQRDFSVVAIYGIAGPPTISGVPNRILYAKAESPTKTRVALGNVYTGVYGDVLCGQGNPQPAGNIGL
jgi:hypothetical protein